MTSSYCWAAVNVDIVQQIAEWKKKLLEKKKAEQQAELDKIRAIEAAKEARHDDVMQHDTTLTTHTDRWIGVPAWKRAIIEKKEAAEREALGI